MRIAGQDERAPEEGMSAAGLFTLCLDGFQNRLAESFSLAHSAQPISVKGNPTTRLVDTCSTRLESTNSKPLGLKSKQ